MDDKHLKTRSLTRSASESKRKAPLPPTSDVSGNLVRSRTVSAADSSLSVRKRVDIDLGVSRILKLLQKFNLVIKISRLKCFHFFRRAHPEIQFML